MFTEGGNVVLTHDHISSCLQQLLLCIPAPRSASKVANKPWLMVKIQIVPPVNIPIPTKIGPKMGGEFTYPNMVALCNFDQPFA